METQIARSYVRYKEKEKESEPHVDHVPLIILGGHFHSHCYCLLAAQFDPLIGLPARIWDCPQFIRTCGKVLDKYRKESIIVGVIRNGYCSFIAGSVQRTYSSA